MMDSGSPTEAQVQQAYEWCLQQYADRQDVTGIDIGRAQGVDHPTAEKVIRIHFRPNASAPDPAWRSEVPEQVNGVKIVTITADYGPE